MQAVSKLWSFIDGWSGYGRCHRRRVPFWSPESSFLCTGVGNPSLGDVLQWHEVKSQEAMKPWDFVAKIMVRLSWAGSPWGFPLVQNIGNSMQFTTKAQQEWYRMMLANMNSSGINQQCDIPNIPQKKKKQEIHESWRTFPVPARHQAFTRLHGQQGRDHIARHGREEELGGRPCQRSPWRC